MDWNLINSLTTIVAWLILGFVIFRTYQKQDEEERPKLIKIFFIVMFGLFSFSINLPAFGELVSVAVLPIGVWLTLAFTEKSGRWQNYRKYSWIGFLANYLFLAGTLVGIFISSVIYPEGEIETYLDEVSEAELIAIHPSATEGVLNAEQFQEDISSFEPEYADIIKWFDDAMVQKQSLEPDGTGQIEEKFPYIIIGTESKEGKRVQVYLEADGKGLLVTTDEHQYYYRSPSATFLTKGVDEE